MFYRSLLSALTLFISISSQASGILQIGDSQSVGIFGKTLHQKIRSETKINYTIGARGGSGVASWFDYKLQKGNFRVYQASGKIISLAPQSMPSLEEFISRHNPDTIIVQLGGNMVHLSNKQVQANVSKMLNLVKKQTSNCIWIGPPNGHKRPEPRFSEFYPVLKETVEKEGCLFVDSRKYTTYPAGRGDGIHYDTLGEEGKRLVKIWVNQLYKKIESKIKNN